MSDSFGRAIDAKDHFTKNHSDEVAVVAQTLAQIMGFSPRTADVIHIAGHLHDIGKIGVPDSLLAKPGPLTEAEWRLIIKHPATGAAILSPVEAMSCMGVPELVLFHHERFDGKGYPKGLAGTRIPMGARIISLADSLSAMLQARPYRAALSFDDACRMIGQCSGTQFDPDVVSAFLENRDIVHQLLLSVRVTDSSSLSVGDH
jgi:HD-GYP domain-containing protein (c-di-GMP phosphodiesterase class II)